MKIVKEAVYASIFGAGVCLASCGKNNNEDTATPVEDNNRTEQVNETEMDSLVSTDTVVPAL